MPAFHVSMSSSPTLSVVVAPPSAWIPMGGEFKPSFNSFRHSPRLFAVAIFSASFVYGQPLFIRYRKHCGWLHRVANIIERSLH